MTSTSNFMSASAAASYHEKDNYYMSGSILADKDGENISEGGKWFGKTAEQLGFKEGDKVNMKDFYALANGINPQNFTDEQYKTLKDLDKTAETLKTEFNKIQKLEAGATKDARLTAYKEVVKAHNDLRAEFTKSLEPEQTKEPLDGKTKHADSKSQLLKAEIKTSDPADVLDTLKIDYKVMNNGTRYEFAMRDERTASANLYLDQKSGEWKFHDFGDGKSGDIINIAQEKLGLDFKEARAFVADKLGIKTNEINTLSKEELDKRLTDTKSRQVDNQEKAKEFAGDSKVAKVEAIDKNDPEAARFLASRGFDKGELPGWFQKIEGEYTKTGYDGKPYLMTQSGYGVVADGNKGADIHLKEPIKLRDGKVLKTQSFGEKGITTIEGGEKNLAIFESKNDAVAAFQQGIIKDSTIVIANGTVNASKVVEHLQNNQYENITFFNQNDVAGAKFVEKIATEAELKEFGFTKYFFENKQDINDLHKAGINLAERQDKGNLEDFKARVEAKREDYIGVEEKIYIQNEQTKEAYSKYKESGKLPIEKAELAALRNGAVGAKDVIVTAEALKAMQEKGYSAKAAFDDMAKAVGVGQMEISKELEKIGIENGANPNQPVPKSAVENYEITRNEEIYKQLDIKIEDKELKEFVSSLKETAVKEIQEAQLQQNKGTTQQVEVDNGFDAKLVRDTKDKDTGMLEHGRAGYDTTFSPAKSVSVMALVAGDTRVIDKHNEAVATTMKYLESHFAQTREKNEETGERERVNTGNIAAAQFNHFTSRGVAKDASPDPQLHTHNFIFNITNSDGTMRSLSNEEMLTATKLAGQMYQNTLANKLENDLGYKTEWGMKGGNYTFEIKGVDKEVLDAFSKRDAEIDKAVEKREEELGRKLNDKELSEFRQEAALNTRVSKETQNMAELEKDWEKQLNELGHTKESLFEATKNQVNDKTIAKDAQEAIKMAVEKLNAEKSVFSQHEVLHEAARAVQGKATIEELQEAFAKNHGIDKETLKEDTSTLKLADSTSKNSKTELYTSKELLMAEANILKAVEEGKDAGQIISKENFEKAREAAREHFQKEAEEKSEKFYDLTKGQAATFEHIATSNDRIIGVQGDAGTGKTTMLSHLNQSLGDKVDIQGLAFTGKAAGEIEKASGIQSQTIDSFLSKKMEEPKGDKQKIFIIDEASMVGTKKLEAIIARAEKMDAKVVLMGDSKQLKAVDAGDMFSKLQDSGMATSQMEEAVRQTTDFAKGVVSDFTNTSTIKDGLDKLEQSGRLIAAIEKKTTLKEIEPQIGMYASPGDRDNFGEVIGVDTQNGKITLKFTNPETEKTFTKEFDRNDVKFKEEQTTSANDRGVEFVKGQYIQNVSKDYFDNGLNSTLALTTLNSERAEFNKAIRENLQDKKVVGKDSITVETYQNYNLNEIDKKFAGNYQVGQILQGSRHFGDIKAGKYSQIVDVNKQDNTVALKYTTIKGEERTKEIDASKLGSFNAFTAQKMDFAQGDKIAFEKNDKNLGVQNGETAVVKSITEDGQMTVIRDGKELTIDTNSYKHINHGYAMTTHKSQGQTAKNVHIFADSKHGISSFNAGYVQMSRAKENITLYTDDRERLEQKYQAEMIKENASDYKNISEFAEEKEAINKQQNNDTQNTTTHQENPQHQEHITDSKDANVQSAQHESPKFDKDQYKNGIDDVNFYMNLTGSFQLPKESEIIIDHSRYLGMQKRLETLEKYNVVRNNGGTYGITNRFNYDLAMQYEKGVYQQKQSELSKTQNNFNSFRNDFVGALKTFGVNQKGMRQRGAEGDAISTVLSFAFAGAKFIAKGVANTYKKGLISIATHQLESKLSTEQPSSLENDTKPSVLDEPKEQEQKTDSADSEKEKNKDEEKQEREIEDKVNRHKEDVDIFADKAQFEEQLREAIGLNDKPEEKIDHEKMEDISPSSKQDDKDNSIELEKDNDKEEAVSQEKEAEKESERDERERDGD